jgi:hypothetical protein
MPVPSGKEGCASRATIDLLIATSATRVDGRSIGPVRKSTSSLVAARCRARVVSSGHADVAYGPLKKGGSA